MGSYSTGGEDPLGYDTTMASARIHESAEVSESAQIGYGASIWQYAHIRENAKIGTNSIIGRGAYVGTGVQIGDNCKIQNYALVYEPAKLEDGVFIGPSVVLTNDEYPRAINPDSTLKIHSDWNPVGVTIHKGASIGAGSICVAPVEIGEWALVAAGSTVTKDVPAFALVAGTPAKIINWVGKSGIPLKKISETKFECPKTGEIYVLTSSDKLALK